MPDYRQPGRILMTADCIGGVWNYCLELARSEAFRRTRICLATLGGPLSREQAAEVLRLPQVQVEESHFKLEWMEQPWEDVARSGAWLLRLADQFKPDLIHLNGYCHGALPFRAPKLVVGHSCVLSWWQSVKGEAAPESWERYREAVTAGLQGADLVVAPSQTMLDSLRQFYGPFPSSRVIYNGCRPERFKPASKEPFILSAGRVWDEAKNIALLAAIAPDISWPVYVAGSDRHPGDPQRKFSSGKVSFLGSLSQDLLAQWYGRASIYALPARYEPFGLSVLEAALSGCALVLGDIPSLREIWDESALFLSPQDGAAWRDALQQLCENSSWRNAWAERARQHALQLTSQRMAAAYQETYRSMLEPEHQTEELAACG